jgi:hypothetical protein
VTRGMRLFDLCVKYICLVLGFNTILVPRSKPSVYYFASSVIVRLSKTATFYMYIAQCSFCDVPYLRVWLSSTNIKISNWWYRPWWFQTLFFQKEMLIMCHFPITADKCCRSSSFLSLRQTWVLTDSCHCHEFCHLSSVWTCTKIGCVVVRTAES